MKNLVLMVVVLLMSCFQTSHAKEFNFSQVTILTAKYSVVKCDAVVVTHQPKVFFSFLIKWFTNKVVPKVVNFLKQQVRTFAKNKSINLLSQDGNSGDTETITIQIENQDGHYVTDTYCEDHDGDNVGDHYEHFEDDTVEGLESHVLESVEHQVTWLENNYGK